MAAWEYFTSNKQWELYLKDILRKSDKTLLDAVVAIYDRQTDEEKMSGQSTEENHIGFSKIDAKSLTNIAVKIKRKEELTFQEMCMTRNKMPKYWKQLMVILKDKAHKKNLIDNTKLERKFQEDQEKYEQEVKKQRLELFRKNNEDMRLCAENGIACLYGICSECIVRNGFQQHMELETEVQNEENAEMEKLLEPMF